MRLLLRVVLVTGVTNQQPLMYTRYKIRLSPEIAWEGLQTLQNKLPMLVPKLPGLHRVAVSLTLRDLDQGVVFLAKIEWGGLSMASATCIHGAVDLGLQRLQSIATKNA